MAFWHHYVTRFSVEVPLGSLAGVLSFRISLSTLATLRKASLFLGRTLLSQFRYLNILNILYI